MPCRAVCFLTTTLIFTDWEPTTFSCQWTVLTEPESLTTRGMGHKHLTTKVYLRVQFSIVFFLSILTWNNTFNWVGYSRLFVLQWKAVEDLCSFLALKSRIVRGTIITDLGLVAMKARTFSLLVVSLLLEAGRVSGNLALEYYCWDLFSSITKTCEITKFFDTCHIVRSAPFTPKLFKHV